MRSRGSSMACSTCAIGFAPRPLQSSAHGLMIASDCAGVSCTIARAGAHLEARPEYRLGPDSKWWPSCTQE